MRVSIGVNGNTVPYGVTMTELCRIGDMILNPVCIRSYRLLPQDTCLLGILVFADASECHLHKNFADDVLLHNWLVSRALVVRVVPFSSDSVRKAEEELAECSSATSRTPPLVARSRLATDGTSAK